MKILLSCPIGIGNYLLAYPACAAIRRRRPDLELHLLGLRNNIRDWAAGDPLWNGVHIFDPTRVRGIGAIVRIVNDLRRERFGACLNFFPENKWQYNLLPLMAGIPRRHAFRYRLKRWSSLSFLNNHLLDVDASLHDIPQNLALAGHFLGVGVANEATVFPALFGPEHEEWARAWIHAHTSRSTLIGIHPGSSADHGMDAKRWPVDRFAQLADLAAAHLGADVLVLGGPEEAPLKQGMVAGMKRAAIAVDTPSLRHTAALVRQCGLVICNDSGIMHMAACMGVPTAGIFGPTDERRNGPAGPRALAIRHGMPGFPLWTAENVGVRAAPRGLDPMAPLKALSAEEAWEKIAAWLPSK